MPGRTIIIENNYRCGFNGKELDKEVIQYDYGFRIYDPRLGKFKSLDPLQKKYPELTPYQFASNSPIAGIDLDGREFEWYFVDYLENKMFGTSHVKKYGEGFKLQANKAVKGIGEMFKEGYKAFATGRWIPVMGGIDPRRNLQTSQSLQKSVDALANTGKAIVNEYTSLIKNAVQGDERAMGALTFEVLMLLPPGGEEIKGASGGRFIARTFEATVSNGERIATLGIKDGMEVAWGKGLEVAQEFLGKEYKEIEPGRFVSKDGTRQVRMGEHELNSNAPLHLNLETLKPNPQKPGKMTREKNIHIYLKE